MPAFLKGLVALLAVTTQTAVAATFQVGCAGTSEDVIDLAAAIDYANDEANFPGIDTIRLTAGCTYQFEQPGNYWYGPNALPPIQSSIVVEGNGANLVRDASLASDAAHAFRFFYISGGLDGELPPGALTLKNLTLQGGLARGGDSDGGGGGAGMGGAAFNQGTLILSAVTMINNVARGGDSGSATAGSGGGGMGEDSPPSGTGGGFGGPLGDQFGGEAGQGDVEGSGGGGGGGFLSTSSGANGGSFHGGKGGGLGVLGGGAFGSSGPFGDGGSGAQSGDASGGGFGHGGGQSGGGGGIGGGGGTCAGGGFGGGAGACAGIGGGGGLGGGAVGGGGAGMGGAIFNHRGAVILNNVTATADEARGGTTDMSGKDGSGFGAVVFNLNGIVDVYFSTMYANSVSNSNSSGSATADATIYSFTYYKKIEDGSPSTSGLAIENSIVSGTSSSGGAANDDIVNNYDVGLNPYPYSSSDLTFIGSNIVGSVVALAPQSVHGTTPLTADPLMGSLADNGAPDAPQTMAPGIGSPAIDAAVDRCVLVDERGFGRPLTSCTIGAFEAKPVFDRLFAGTFE